MAMGMGMMGNGRGAASVSVVLMMVVSLEVLLLLAAGTSAAAVSGGAIRLPSDVIGDVAGLAAAMATSKLKQSEEETRPWECCDLAVCTRSIPSTCWCFDIVDQCSDACKKCIRREDSRHVCADNYEGEPAPRCHNFLHSRNGGHGGLADGGAGLAAAAVVMADAEKAGGNDDDKRPWKCCDLSMCTRSWPPICFCIDKVEQCASTCEECEEVEVSGNGHHYYRCLDGYPGDPGPTCDGQGGGVEWARRLVRGHRF